MAAEIKPDAALPPFGCRLDYLRRLAGLTRTEAAKRLGVSRTTLFRWERCQSQPDLLTLALMADVYSRPFHQLFGGLSSADVRHSFGSPSASG